MFGFLMSGIPRDHKVVHQSPVFIKEWLRSANTIIERLRLKSATIKMQIKKAKQQLIQREELGEALHAVDFEQLNIQNKDYARMIEEKNRYVIEMKRIAGHYHLKLTQHKQKLSNLLLALNEVKKDITLKKEQIEELEAERANVEADVIRMDERLKNLLTFMNNHTVPDILDFVKLTVELKELQKTYKLLERRRNVEKIIYQTSKKQIRNVKLTSSSKMMKKLKLISNTIFPIAPYDRPSMVVSES
ncbi:coiled-coil domain-containing protein 113-like [Hylaeus volcanicus]|uniref:coiled-coil domain-containing protein 113-like n=1 Tax=Hylaeus volcanicus TaxID=313075 RepID=UPI0023B849A2|nr:coiled-coil domain-containing protein 113-like [Hylaeus volcanicus]